ncbi:zinc protease [Kushneria avicenniae]|uniref:Zinc protease n=2 Tax=Kushneria avicenniae TaxID=402385 RepID=A0A1I1JC04_9GAMM|nr:zinc protease [Kushneria avicenniae]
MDNVSSRGWSGVSRSRRLLAGLCLVVASIGIAQAQEQPDDVLRTTLDNGLEVVIVHSDLAPVVTTQVNYHVGSSEASSEFPGTAHAVEHMMFRGGPGLSKDQLSVISANMGGNMNAFTENDRTQYHFTVPADDLNVALNIEASRMKAVDMSEADWAQERGAIEQEVSGNLSNPAFRFYTQLVGELYRGTPYAWTPLGTRDSFDNTTAADLKAFHDQWYVPNNATLVIAGDVDPQQALGQVKTLFGDIPEKTLPERPDFDFEPVTARTIELPTNSPYGSIYMGWRTPGLQDDDFAATQVLLDVLGSERGELTAMGYDGTALAGGMGGQLQPHAGLAMAVGVFPRGGDPAPIRARMQEIIADVVKTGVDPSLVEAAKRRIIAEVDASRESVSGLASAWSDALIKRGLDSPQDMKAQYEAVTVDDVNALAKRLLTPERAVTAILTPEASGAPTSSEGYGEPENLTSAPEGPVELPTWAEHAFDNLDIPVSTLAPKDYRLDNGLRLIVQPETASDRVMVSGAIDTNANVQMPPGKEGVSDILEGMYGYGSQTLDRRALRAAVDALGAEESAGTSFGLVVPKAHLDEGLALLADHQLHPNFSEEAFNTIRQQSVQALPGRLESPGFQNAYAMLGALLPEDDPQQRHATPETLDSITLEDVKQYFARISRPDMTTMVVVGDVNPEQVRDQVERYFGDWQAQGQQPDVEYPSVALNAAGAYHTPDSAASQSQVIMSQMLNVNRDSPDRFALFLGNQVLSGDFASRLHQDLREKRGLVYGVSSNLSLDAHRGRFNVSFGSDPDKAARARDLVVQNLKRMQNEPVSDSELHRAKSILLRAMPMQAASYGAISSSLLNLALSDKPLDATTRAAEQFVKLTSDDVQEAFRAHIRPDGFVTGVRGPAMQ